MMTSRERLLSVIRNEVPDRVPISTYELVGWDKDSWENKQESYKGLMDYIRVNTDCMYMTGVPTVNTYIEEHTESVRWRKGNSVFNRTIIKTPKGDIEKLDRVDDNVNTVWHVEHLVKNDEDMEKFLSIPGDLVPVNLSHLEKQQETLGDKGILLISIADPICTAAELFEFGDFTVKAFTDRKGFTRLLDNIFEQQMYFLKDMLRKGAGPLFRICGPEYATPPYLMPEQFHEYVCRYDKEIIKLIHEYGQYARIHCHGKIRNILPHIAEMEPDAIDPVEAYTSGDIELGEVKRLYGDRICLMGNLQLRDLEYASPEDMERIVKNCMEQGKPGGGFVIMPTAAPINVPISPVTERNYKIFIDTALKYGKY